MSVPALMCLGLKPSVIHSQSYYFSLCSITSSADLLWLFALENVKMQEKGIKKKKKNRVCLHVSAKVCFIQHTTLWVGIETSASTMLQISHCAPLKQLCLWSRVSKTQSFFDLWDSALRCKQFSSTSCVPPSNLVRLLL